MRIKPDTVKTYLEIGHKSRAPWRSPKEFQTFLGVESAARITLSAKGLGYVLNVIEEPAERIVALREAYSLAERLLIVSTMASGHETYAHSR